jgi:hypothetical protein
MASADALGRRAVLGGYLALSLLALGVVPGARAEPSADAARELVETVGHKVLSILRDPGLSQQL